LHPHPQWPPHPNPRLPHPPLRSSLICGASHCTTNHSRPGHTIQIQPQRTPRRGERREKPKNCFLSASLRLCLLAILQAVVQ
jgi:hypothetical protein